MKVTALFIELIDTRVFVREELLGQKEKKVKSFDKFNAIEGQSVPEKIKECRHLQNNFECRK